MNGWMNGWMSEWDGLLFAKACLAVGIPFAAETETFQAAAFKIQISEDLNLKMSAFFFFFFFSGQVLGIEPKGFTHSKQVFYH